jgi:hypothetical protein
MVVTFYFDPNITIPVKKYGGTERILYWLMKELVKKGNTIYFIGSKESKVFDIGVNLIPFDGGDWRTLIPKNTDIVQLFQNDSNVDFPSLNTIEGNE